MKTAVTNSTGPEIQGTPPRRQICVAIILDTASGRSLANRYAHLRRNGTSRCTSTSPTVVLHVLGGLRDSAPAVIVHSLGSGALRCRRRARLSPP